MSVINGIVLFSNVKFFVGLFAAENVFGDGFDVDSGVPAVLVFAEVGHFFFFFWSKKIFSAKKKFQKF